MSTSNPITVLLPVLAFLAVAPSSAQEITQTDLDHAVGIYRLPTSHGSSIYFPPGSVQLNESAMASILTTAARLKDESGLLVTVVGYADDLDEAAHGDELRTGRATVVIDALLAEGVPRQRMLPGTLPEAQDTLPCASEYCRQNYRRVGLLFSRVIFRADRTPGAMVATGPRR